MQFYLGWRLTRVRHAQADAIIANSNGNWPICGLLQTKCVVAKLLTRLPACLNFGCWSQADTNGTQYPQTHRK
jgi:hypothetical protein